MSEETSHPLQFFNDLIRQGHLAAMREGFCHPTDPGDRYDADTDLLSWIDQETGSRMGWSWTTYMEGLLRPEFRKALGQIGDDLRRASSDAHCQRLATAYLRFLGVLIEDVRKAFDERTRDPVEICLATLQERVGVYLHTTGEESAPVARKEDALPSPSGEGKVEEQASATGKKRGRPRDASAPQDEISKWARHYAQSPKYVHKKRGAWTGKPNVLRIVSKLETDHPEICGGKSTRRLQDRVTEALSDLLKGL